MENIINWVADHWELTLAPILWALLRLVPTSKNLDIVQQLLKLLDRIIPNLKKGGGKFTVVTILLLASISSFAQINGNFKTLRLVNVISPTDTANVLPINATIYYNEVTGKLMAYEDGAWKQLIQSGGGLTTASNGLTASGSNVELGGTLTKNTNITGAFSLAFLTNTVNLQPTTAMNFRVGTGGQIVQTPTNYQQAGFTGAVVLGNNSGTGTTNVIGGTSLTLRANSGPTNIGVSTQPVAISGSSLTFNGSPIGGITNTAANNEIPKSDGTNIVPSGIFAATPGQLTIGSTSISDGEYLWTVESAVSNANLRLRPKGTTGSIIVDVNGNGGSFEILDLANAGNGINTNFQASLIDLFAQKGTNDPIFRIQGAGGVSGNTEGNELRLSGGGAFLGSGNNGGNLFLSGGGGDGAGIDGYIILNALPTASPCGTAPSGTIWNDAGTLKICP